MKKAYKAILSFLIIPLSLTSFSSSTLTAKEKPRHLPRLSLNEVAAKIPCNLPQCQRLIKRHLIRDIKGCQLDPADVARAPELMAQGGLKSKKVRGANFYLSFVPGSYSYDATLNDDGGITLNAKVYFTNPRKISAEDRANMQDKLNKAALKWQGTNPYSFPLRFNFELTQVRRKSDVTARLTDDYSRGPYFHEWTTAWGFHTVAHEMGHVMGLDDEYSNTFGAIREALTYCSRSSMMCGSVGEAQPYHYYMIVRRLLCQLKI